MTQSPPKLDWVLDGWVDYNDALLEALDAMDDEDLLRADAPDRRSPADLLRHIALGRVVWLTRIGAPGFAELDYAVPRHHVLPDGTRFLDEGSVPLERGVLRDWLLRTGSALRSTLAEWTAEDLRPAVRHDYQGTAYALSRQWVLFRILLHDVHHGGQLSMLCQERGIDAPSLVQLGGHLPVPPVCV